MVRPLNQLRLAEKKLREIRRLIKRGEWDRTKMLLASCGVGPSWPEAPGGSYIYARLEEEYAFDRDGTSAALERFTELSQTDSVFRSEGLIGRARMLSRLNEKENANEILELCQQAIDIDGNARAMMISGCVLERVKHDPRAASTLYLRAYRRGHPWGLRHYAQLQAKQGKLLLSWAAHVVASMTSPFLVLRFGLREAFK